MGLSDGKGVPLAVVLALWSVLSTNSLPFRLDEMMEKKISLDHSPLHPI